NACLQELTFANALIELGQYDDGRKHVEHSIAVAEQMGLASAAANGKHVLGIAHLRNGNLGGAIAMQQEAQRAFAAKGNKRLEGGALCWLAMAYLAAGSHDEATKAAKQAVNLLTQTPPALALALAVSAGVSLAKNELPAALEIASEALKLANRPG